MNQIKKRRPTNPKRNLALEAASTLRKEIISGAYRPGDSLAEPVLAERFGVSRAPIREALIELEREGLVQFETTGRTRVRPLTEEDLIEIVDTRIALEAMGARRATAGWTAADSLWVSKNIAAQSKASTVAKLTALDVEMHEYIMIRSGNERLVGLWECIRPQFQMWLAHTHRLQATLKFEPRMVTVDAHRKLLRAIESGDCERAASAMSAHVAAWHEWLPSTFPLKAERRKRRVTKSVSLFVFAAFFTLFATHPAATAAKETDSVFFEKEIRPILADRCISCHSTKKQKGDLDLERFTSLDQIKKEPMIWLSVQEQLASNEMPPKKEPQLSAEQKTTLVKWVQATLDEVALANAGDPGPVVMRRLSNMEYTYTVRDLTGVTSLDPAKEFPVDGAAGEGFTNVGAALVMSPALITKYLDAAKDIASHAVLTPDGIHFSPSTSARDWTDETLAKIRAIYARHTSAGEGSQTVAQGIKLDTGTGSGHLPLARYLDALQGRASSEGLSPKYLGMLRVALTSTQPSVLLDPLRAKFKAKQLTAADIEPWQKVLWRFANIGHIGKANGPKAWQEPVTPLVPQQELRVKLNSDGDTTLYLSTGDAGGSEGDEVVWENPRIATPKKPDMLLGASLRSRASEVVEFHVPAALAKGTEFVVNGRLAAKGEGSVQMQVLTEKPPATQGLVAGSLQTGLKNGKWSDNNLVTQHSAPIIVNDGSEARKHFETAFDDFRALFPIALCYTKIVPVDEVVTLTLFHREDDQLKRLMLDEAQSAELDRMWNELRFVSESPLKQVDVFEQLWQYATQDAKPEAFEPMREPIMRGAAEFKKLLVDVEPKHVQAVLDFAQRAWRHALTSAEQNELRALYQKLRSQELPHATAVRMLLARVLVAPAFLYRGEKPAPGPKAAPVNDTELATRLSYFLWSSAPDDELRALATSGKLHEPDILAAQARRMMKHANVRRLATEFGCQWLHVRDLETLDEKSERHFPTFVSLRGAMQEEAVRFFTDLFQADRSVLSLLDADYTFVNADLARHYGLKAEEWGQTNPSEHSPAPILLPSSDWRRVDHIREQGRGGLLAFAATLAKQSGASRTSPILRGNWLSEVVLGEKLPRPPKGVPVLPEEAPQGLTERQLIERHSSDAKCAGCHQRIDPFGFALEGFDAIGRARSKDTAGLAIDTKAKLPDGTQLEGLDSLRSYLVNTRRDDFLRQFCRKLLGYALGRSVQLSDKPLIETMLARLKENDCHIGSAIELIVRSPQLREVRGRDFQVN